MLESTAVAYDEELADRVREHLVDVKGVTEREMFGGVSFMVAGNLCAGVLGDDLVVRIDPTLHHDALTRPGAREFEMGGRSSRGMIRVAPVGVAEDLDLALWLRLGLAQATTRPPKKAAAKKKAGPKKKTAPAKKKAAAKKAPASKKKMAPAKKAPASKKNRAPAKKKVAPARKKAPVKKKAPARKTKAPAKKKKAVPAKRKATRSRK